MNTSMDGLRLVLIGPPGSGKGTQAQFLSEACEVGHVSTGELLRSHAREGTDLGKSAAQTMKAGKLVPDDLVAEMLAELYREKGGEGVGFVLDGYPRSESQARALSSFLENREQALHKVLLLELEDDAIVGRLIDRRTCPECGRSYHLQAAPPKVEGRCDEDGAELVWRSDDTEAVIRERLSTYHEQTKPVVEYYQQKGLLARIDAARPIEEVRQQIEEVLQSLKS